MAKTITTADIGESHQIRFWERVAKSDGCWEWTGPGSHGGYGRASYGVRRIALAHQVSWVLAHGSLDTGVWCVLHHCDNPCCVRPDHLFVGTKGDNARDMASKGRQFLQRNPKAMSGHKHWARRRPELVMRGEEHARAELTEEQVVRLRERVAAGETRRAVAQSLGVHEATVARIASGGAWLHAGGPITPSRITKRTKRSPRT